MSQSLNETLASYSAKAVFRGHLCIVHKMVFPDIKLKSSRFDPNIQPEPNDPNFYCKSCKFKYSNVTTYRVHLFQMHEIGTQPRRQIRPNLNIQPDPNDPNFYCKSCEHNYLNNTKYEIHLRSVHKMILKGLKQTIS